MTAISCTQLEGPVSEDDSVFQIKDGKKISWGSGDLVRKCGSMETLTAVGGLYKNLTTVQAIWLKSKVPIEIHQVEQALHILTRQISLLQFCLAKRNYRYWFRRMKEHVIDFEASNDDAMSVYEEMVFSHFDMWNGPLWRARLVFTNANDLSDDQQSYSAVLVFAVHHCITDGTTNMMICRETIKILNKIVRGDDIIPQPSPIAPLIDDCDIEHPNLKFTAKVAGKKFKSTLIKNYNKKSSFSGSFPLPKTKIPQTKVLFDSMSPIETKNLIKQCKGVGVTVHACITIASNFALLKTAQAHSKSSLGEYSVRVCHCVNVRRYFQEEHKDAAGCHFSIMESKSKMDLSKHKNFWQYTKDTHDTFKELLETDHEPVKMIPLLQYASVIIPANSYLTSKGYKNKTDCHYMTTNMGNLKTLLPDASSDDAVEITDIRRSVCMNYMSNPFLLTFHTFRDSFKISMDYFTNKMDETIAKEYFNTLKQFLRNLANNGTIY